MPEDITLQLPLREMAPNHSKQRVGLIVPARQVIMCLWNCLPSSPPGEISPQKTRSLCDVLLRQLSISSSPPSVQLGCCRHKDQTIETRVNARAFLTFFDVF